MILEAQAFDSANPSAGAGEALSPSVDQFVPRISVEAYCVTPAFAAAMQGASQDRRMAKATVNVSMGGIKQAVKVYAETHTPNLVIVETVEGGFGLFAELESLAAVCDENTKVMVAGSSNDVTLYRELIRQGISEYVVTPAAPMQVIDTLASIYASSESKPAARTIAIVGVKGGVGSSVIAHNLAWLMAENIRRETLLVDLDIEFGTAGLNFNMDVKRGVLDALNDIQEFDDVKLMRIIHEHSEKLKLLAAPATLNDDLVVDDTGMLTLLDVVRQATDVVVLDVPHIWSPLSRRALMQADEVVLVATPDLACLRNLKTIYDRLKNARRNDVPPRIILNQTGMNKRPEIPQKDFEEIIGAPIEVVLPFDGELFGQAANNGLMLAEVKKNHRVVGDLRALAARLNGCTFTAEKPKGPLIALFSRLGKKKQVKA